MILRDDILYPNALGAIIIDENLWFVNHVLNALMKVSLHDWKLVDYYPLKKYEFSQGCLYHNLIKVDRKLVLIPDVCANSIAIFDMDTEQQEFVELEDNLLVMSVAQYEGKLWFFSKYPTDILKIFIFDMQTNKVFRHFALEKEIEDCLPLDIWKNDLLSSVVFSQEKFWISIWYTNYLIEVEPGACRSILHELQDINGHCIVETSDGVVLGNQGTMDICDIELSTGKIKTYEVNRVEQLSDGAYAKIYCIGQKIIAIPCFSERIVIIDRKTEEITIANIQVDDNILPLPSREGYPCYQKACVVNGNEIIVLPVAGTSLRVLDLDTMHVRAHKIEVGTKWIEQCYLENMKEFLKYPGVVYENDIPFKVFAKYVIDSTGKNDTSD